MTTTELTKTERRVLAAVRWETERVLAEAAAEAVRFGWAEQITGAALGFSSIYRAARILAMGRAPGELQVHTALGKLVARGLVAKETVTGMGGGFTTYRLTTEGQA